MSPCLTCLNTIGLTLDALHIQDGGFPFWWLFLLDSILIIYVCYAIEFAICSLVQALVSFMLTIRTLRYGAFLRITLDFN